MSNTDRPLRTNGYAVWQGSAQDMVGGRKKPIPGVWRAVAALSRKVSPRRCSENGNLEAVWAYTSEGTGCAEACMLVFGALEATLSQRNVEEAAQQSWGELHSQPPSAGQLFFQRQWETLKGLREGSWTSLLRMNYCVKTEGGNYFNCMNKKSDSWGRRAILLCRPGWPRIWSSSLSAECATMPSLTTRPWNI